MTKFLLIFSILLLGIQQLKAQEIVYAKSIIDTLCSPSYYGRAYTNDGDKKAANFIAGELTKNNCKPFNSRFFQEFSLNVNTFSEEMFLQINGVRQTPAIDFLVNSNSCSIVGEFKIRVFNSKNFQSINQFIHSNNQKHFFILDTLGMNNKVEGEKLMAFKDNRLNAAGIIEITDKDLVFAPAIYQANFVSLKLKRQNLPSKISKLKINIKNKFKENYKTQNIAAYIKGTIDSFIVFSAHYDHVGQMGKETYFPGANDNASGTAMLLSLAKHFSEHKPKYSVAFLFFSAEEAGILGSMHYVQNPLFPLSEIKFLTNMDMVGSGDEGIKVVNATVFTKEFDLLKTINDKKNYLSNIGSRGPAANSDHYFFYANKVPSFFIYTLGKYKEYHNIYDKSENLPLNKFAELFNLMVDFTLEIK